MTLTLSLNNVGSLAPGFYPAPITLTNTSTGRGTTKRNITLLVYGALAAIPSSGTAPLIGTWLPPRRGLPVGSPQVPPLTKI
jgi:hypothetical protein